MKIEVNLTKAKKKMSSSSVDKGQYALANQFLADATPFVPKKDDALRISGKVDGRGESASWNTKYAKAQFYGFVGRGGHRVYNYTTPGTGRRWDLRAKGRHMRDWLKAFVKGAGW